MTAATPSVRLSMFKEADMGRMRGQRITKNNPYKRGTKWVVRWREDVRLVSGRIERREFKLSIADCVGPRRISKREADRLADEMIFARLDKASLVPQSLATVSQFIKQKFRPNVLAKTRSPHYETMLKHVERYLGKLKLRDVRADDLHKLVNDMLDRKYSGQTIRHLVATVRRIFRHAKELEWFAGELPTEFVRVQVRHKQRGTLSAGHVRSIAALLPSPYRELVLILACIGLRIGEALGLRWKWVNLTPETVTRDGVMLPPFSLAVREQWRRSEWVDVLKTTGSEGVLPLSQPLVGELARLKARTSWSGPEHPVFTVRAGRPLTAHAAAARKLKPVLKKLGLPKEVSWHLFRHTLASLADGHLTTPQRQAVLRHGDAKQTARYTHPDFEEIRRGLDAVAAEIFEDDGGMVQ